MPGTSNRNPTTTSCSAFLLTPKALRRKIPAIAVHLAAQGNPALGKAATRRKQICNICPVGPCNASIRNVPLAVIGFAPIFPAPTPALSSALAAAAPFKPFRRRSARVFVCARAPSPRVRRCDRAEPALVNQFCFGNHAKVSRARQPAYLALLVVTLSLPTGVRAQSSEQPGAFETNASKSRIAYPDTQAGLKQLATDIIKAQKENNASQAQELFESFVLPNFREWYAQNFNEPAIARAVPAYAASAPRLPAQLASVFLGNYAEGFRSIEAVRYDDLESACTSTAQVFSAMTVRKTRVPLYELRFTHGDRFKAVFAFAYVGGAFRLVLTPNFSKSIGGTPEQADGAGSTVSKPDGRIRMGGPVQAASLVCRVQPYYPEEARLQRISGTVRFHTIIGTDGSVKQLEVVTGPPMLVDAAKRAVSRWRYRPTLLNGEPVEIDTTIDVIFSLSP